MLTKDETAKKLNRAFSVSINADVHRNILLEVIMDVLIDIRDVLSKNNEPIYEEKKSSSNL